ncbi:inositol monophosphatase family protein [Corynebacterium sp. LK28]|uniref:inositol monophosphatase family protein n=1 Tax=Corynebacterium sp. LK28 TaxID=2044579 RepID=UPI00054EFB9A|nr:inositol monophosphatase family protein [Corynebacterium sp. LK28]MBC6794413.1 inositol monophosphatase [Corynebacterium sp. LK28]
MECMATNGNDSSSPIPEDMLNAIIKTFIVAHVDDSDHHLAQALVYNAGRLAWRMRQTGVDTEQKTSVSDVVTAADRAAEKFIADALRAIRPDDGLLGEEGTSVESKSGRTWVIDPVDGTYNFTTGSDYWCSALALVEGSPEDPDALLFGAVHRPAMGYTWFGGPDIPTTRDANRIDLPNTAAELTCLGGYLHPTDIADATRLNNWTAVATQFATVRMLGSASIDLACVAGGELGCWMQHSVASWDWLPGRALVEGAGGVAKKEEKDGTTWFIAGAPDAVEQAAAALREA